MSDEASTQKPTFVFTPLDVPSCSDCDDEPAAVRVILDCPSLGTQIGVEDLCRACAFEKWERVKDDENFHAIQTGIELGENQATPRITVTWGILGVGAEGASIGDLAATVEQLKAKMAAGELPTTDIMLCTHPEHPAIA